jgi:hypothetical protein
MFKVSLYDPFGHFKHKLWPKEGLGVKLDSWPLKVRNRPNFLTCRWHSRHRWKAFDEGYNFAWNFISIGSLHTKLYTPKIAWIPTLGISALGSPETKCHLGVGPVAKHKIYYKGEGGGFPQVRAVVSLVSLCMPMASPYTQNTQTTH